MKTLDCIVNLKAIYFAKLYSYLMILQNVDGVKFSHNSIVEPLNKFEIKPVFNCKDSKCNKANFSFVVPLLGRTLTLPLIRNLRLFTDLREDHCHYLIDDSSHDISLEGAINWCNLAKDGLIFNSQIEISFQYNRTKDRYFIYVQRNKSLNLLFIQAARRSTHPSMDFNVLVAPQSVRGPSKNKLLYGQILMVFDYPLYVSTNHNVSILNEYAYSAMNFVQSYLKELNMSIAVESLVFEKESLIKFPYIFNYTVPLLDAISDFRRKSSLLNPYENYTVFFIHDYHHKSYASTYLGVWCDKFRSVAEGTLLLDYTNFEMTLPQLLSLVWAHEIGHLLGMLHDESVAKCHCNSFYACIMEAYIKQTTGGVWSDCSFDSFQKYSSDPVAECLSYSPYLAPKSPSCGNGILEEGEKCDCGNINCGTCCNGATCWFSTQTAKCGTGICCNFANCLTYNAANAMVCREAISECDLPEYCDGDSEFCPPDRFKHDGTPCSGGYCYKGQCENHSSQCKKIWGDHIESGHLACYNLNSVAYHERDAGKQFGCKLSSKLADVHLINGFNKCPYTDIECGRLICNVTKNATLKVFQGFSHDSYLAIKIYPLIAATCGTITTWAYLRPRDLGSVPNGAACGFNYLGMCIDNRCVPLDEVLESNPCPPTCSDHGTCNDVGGCSCDAGFGGANCSINFNQLAN